LEPPPPPDPPPQAVSPMLVAATASPPVKNCLRFKAMASPYRHCESAFPRGHGHRMTYTAMTVDLMRSPLWRQPQATTLETESQLGRLFYPPLMLPVSAGPVKVGP
jgi:hypothetical protein